MTKFERIYVLADSFHKLAVIPLPIRDMRFFVDSFPKKIINELSNFKNELTPPPEFSSGENAGYFFSDIFNYRWFGDSISNYINRCEELIGKMNRSIAHNFEYVKSTNGYEFRKAIGYLVQGLTYFGEDLNQLDRSVQNDFVADIDWANAEERVRSYTEEPGYSAYFAKLKRAAPILHSFTADFNNRVNALRETSRMMSAPIMSGKDNNPPDVENEETLYHATINADDIYSNGFGKSETQTEGLGGSTESHTGNKAISFTADLYIAKEIMRCLKEAIMISNGEVNGHDILSWSHDPAGIKAGAERVNGELDLNSPEGTFALYRYYLALDKRYDPLFFGTPETFVKIFKGKSQSHVGIIAAKVNMRNPDVSYHVGMLEYRVPPEAVIAIERLIK